MTNRWGNDGNSDRLFSWAPKLLQMVTVAMKLKDANLDSILKSRDITLPTKVRLVKATLWFFQWSCMDVRIGLQRKLSTEELMLLNCVVGEDS